MTVLKTIFVIAIAFAFCPALQADEKSKEADIAGVWHAKASTDDGAREITWTFKKDDDKYTGTSVDAESSDSRKLDRVIVKGKKVTLELDVESDDMKGIIRVEAEEKTFGKLTGEWSIVDSDGKEYMSGNLAAYKEVTFSGDWNATAVLPDEEKLKSVVQLKGKNAKLNGVIKGNSDDEIEIEKITTKDEALHLKFDLELNGETLDCLIKASPKSNNRLVGKWIVLGDDGSESLNGEWFAERKTNSLAGTWKMVAAVPEGEDYSGSMTLKMKDGKYTGVLKSAGGEGIDLTSVKQDGDALQFSLPFEWDGAKGTITIEAKLKNGSLVGEYVFVDSDGEELASDYWQASRKKK